MPPGFDNMSSMKPIQRGVTSGADIPMITELGRSLSLFDCEVNNIEVTCKHSSQMLFSLPVL